MDYRKKVGNFGEKIAISYLKRKGYKIIDRNVKISYKEIDIIASIKEKIVFFEVKTRASRSLGSAEEAINTKKMKFLKKAVSYYIKENKIDANKTRLDFIAIDIFKSKKIANIKHYKDIY